jgi:hypothetical protein
LRPSASDLLQHQWIYENRKTLKKSWRGGQTGYLTRGKQGATGSTEAHESINSVINRMLAAEDDGSLGAPAGQGGMEGGIPSPQLPGFPSAYNSSTSPLRDAVVLASSAVTAPSVTTSPYGTVPLPPLPELKQADLSVSEVAGVHLYSSPNNHLAKSGAGSAAVGAHLGEVITSLQVSRGGIVPSINCQPCPVV